MSFESYKNIAEVLKEFNIRSTEVDFIQELNFSSRISFQEELEFCLREFVVEEIETIFGIVSNGQLWQFGKIEDNIFSKNITSYTISQLNSLLGAIAYIFEQCSEA